MTVLTTEQLDRFAADGFLRLERVVDDVELARLREIYDAVVADPGPLSIDHRTRESTKGSLLQIFVPEQRYPELLDTTFFTSGVQMAAALLDVEAERIEPRSHMIFKPASYGVATPWHQDAAYRPPDASERSVNLWLALDDAPVEAGCMQFVPGSHVGPIHDHDFVVESGSLLTDVKEAVDVDVSAATPCPVPAGGGTLHGFRTLHYTGPNTTDHDRRAWIIILRADQETT